jgi:hypothetical protein
MEHDELNRLLNELALLAKDTAASVTELDEDALLDFVNLRAGIVQAMEPYRKLITDEDKTVIQAILAEEQVIYQKMIQIKEESAEWLAKRQSSKMQSNAYQSQYNYGSLFVDKRE